MAGSSKKAIYAALIGNGMIAITKFAASAYTGSSAMLSEGVHSLVDTGNQVLLLFGMRQAKKPPSEEFPFGHGKEIYFWCFIVAMLIFALGGAISIYQGWQHIMHPVEINNVYINYIVLSLALVFEFGALYVAFKEFNKSRGTDSILKAVSQGKDPTLFVVVFEDSAALIGLLVAMLGLVAYQITGNAVYDGIASVVIGVVLIFTAYWLAAESKGLLIGESANAEVREAMRRLLEADTQIKDINEATTLHMGPDFIVAMISVDFVMDLSADELEDLVTQLNKDVKAIDSRIKRVFIEAERHENHPIPNSA